MNTGQMVEDVRLAVNGCCQTFFYGRPGGGTFSDEEIIQYCLRVVQPFSEKELSTGQKFSEACKLPFNIK
jgi:hypothetical protein